MKPLILFFFRKVFCMTIIYCKPGALAPFAARGTNPKRRGFSEKMKSHEKIGQIAGFG